MLDTPKQWCWFVAVLAAAMVLRVGVYVSVWRDTSRAMTPDSAGYVELADRIDAGAGFVDDTGRAEVFRTPGYPMLLALANRLGGPRTLLALQVLMDIGLVAVTFALATHLTTASSATWAMLFQAVSPLAVAASCRLLTDSVFAFLLGMSVLFWLRADREDRELSLMASALLIAAACYIRPVGVLLAGIMACFVLFTSRGIRRFILFGAVVFLTVGPWVLRNEKQADYRGFSSVASVSVYRYTVAELMAREWEIDVADARYALDREFEQQEFSTVGEEVRYHRAYAQKAIRYEPIEALTVHLSGVKGFWLPGVTDALEVAGMTTGQKGTLDVLHRDGVRAAAEHYFKGNDRAMWIAGVLGMLFAAKLIGVLAFVITRASTPREIPVAGWMLATIVVVLALAGGAASTPRFRVPVDPLLSIAAAAGWLTLIRWRRDDKMPSIESV